MDCTSNLSAMASLEEVSKVQIVIKCDNILPIFTRAKQVRAWVVIRLTPYIYRTFVVISLGYDFM